MAKQKERDSIRNIMPQQAESAAVLTVQDEETFDLYALMLRLLEKWKLLIVAALIGAIVMGVLSFCFITPMYKATSKIYVLNNKDSAVNLSDLQISTYLTNDYQEVFNIWSVHEMVMQKLGLDYSYEKLGKMISINNPANTRILEITVTSPNPEEAQLLANSYAEISREFIAAKMDTAEPSMLEEALLPVVPSSPNKTRNVIMGFLLGLLIAAVYVVIRFMSDDYIRTPEDIEKAVHLPTLGTVMMQDEAYSSGEEKALRTGGRK